MAMARATEDRVSKAEETVRNHYRTLLAEHYTWMVGMPFADKVAEQRDLLRRLGVAPGPRGMAVDLGCGPGFQSIALAELGFRRILAIDTSEALLGELAQRKGAWPIETVNADLRDSARFVGQGQADAILCMGDTLTHLDSYADLPRLFADARNRLAPGGQLALSFRDLSTELEGLDRFIPIRSDADRIMTCFLEYRPDHVVVHDLIHIRTEAGWTLRKSCYRKLRLALAQVEAELRSAGFEIRSSEPEGRLWAIGATPADC